MPMQPIRLHDMRLIHAHDQWVKDSDELPCPYRHSCESLSRPMLWRTPSSRVNDEPGRLLCTSRLRCGPTTKPISTASLAAGNRNHQIVHSMLSEIVSRSVGASSITPPISAGHAWYTPVSRRVRFVSSVVLAVDSSPLLPRSVVQFGCEVGWEPCQAVSQGGDQFQLRVEPSPVGLDSGDRALDTPDFDHRSHTLDWMRRSFV